VNAEANLREELTRRTTPFTPPSREDLVEHLLRPPAGHDHHAVEVGTKAAQQATYHDLQAWHRNAHRVTASGDDIHRLALETQARIRERGM
jgi:hypothetical protein